MRQIDDRTRPLASVLAFALIPLSGLATDVYLPSFPEMANAFHTGPSEIQKTLALFLISYGLAQFFAGTVIDSFGRYRSTLIALGAFVLSNVVLIHAGNIRVIFLMRILQGICAAFIAVGKRAFFVDSYTGEKQRHYTGMLTIVWAAAPITAPFLGGFLQKHFGWASNFYFLAGYAFLMLILEWLFSGETLKVRQPFRLEPVFRVYHKLISAPDFSLGVAVLGVSYSMVMVFNMSVPFIVEMKFHLSPVVTGYCALFSGVSLFFGGLIGKSMKNGDLFRKLFLTGVLQALIVLLLFISADLIKNVPLLMLFVVLIHLMAGIIYNIFFTYCLTKFPQHAGTAGGVTSGGSYLVTSLVIGSLLSIITVTTQHALACCYLILTVTAIGILLVTRRYLTT